MTTTDSYKCRENRFKGPSPVKLIARSGWTSTVEPTRINFSYEMHRKKMRRYIRIYNSPRRLGNKVLTFAAFLATASSVVADDNI